LKRSISIALLSLLIIAAAVDNFAAMKAFGQIGPFQSFHGSSQSFRTYQGFWGVPIYDLLRQCISSTYANGVVTTVSDPVGLCIQQIQDAISQASNTYVDCLWSIYLQVSDNTFGDCIQQFQDFFNELFPPVTPPPSSNGCDQSLWDHVYNPSRLQIINNCITVSGVIDVRKPEADGDYHILLKLDPQFSNLVNSANVNNLGGHLVLEPICMTTVTQADAISACQNFHHDINVPPVGAHVQVTGSYVLDKQHGKWAEIHPVTSITIT
jgi:hypothetical protein